MDRTEAGLTLRSLFERHRAAEEQALAALPNDAAAEQTLAAIEAASSLEVDGIRVEVRRRRTIDWCPHPRCRYSRLRQVCAWPSHGETYVHARQGEANIREGLLWHLLAEHPPAGPPSDDETAVLKLLED
jgi:hypothetical protein